MVQKSQELSISRESENDMEAWEPPRGLLVSPTGFFSPHQHAEEDDDDEDEHALLTQALPLSLREPVHDDSDSNSHVGDDDEISGSADRSEHQRQNHQLQQIVEILDRAIAILGVEMITESDTTSLFCTGESAEMRGDQPSQ